MKNILVAVLAFTTLIARAEAPKSTAARLAHEAIQRKAHFIKVENKFPVIAGCLDKDRQALHNKIENGEMIPFNELTDALTEWHRKRGEKEPSSNELNAILLKLRTGANKSNPHQLKVSTDDALFAHFKEDSDYNANATSIVDICKNNELQCYSGTVLNQVLARKLLGRDEFQNQNPVIIFESGHVLPGYMEPKIGGGWHLHGIETTSLGAAEVTYGDTTKLNRDIRVIDAKDWILSELFEDCMAKPKEFADEVLARTAKGYGIPLAVTEKAIHDKHAPNTNMTVGALKGAALNASIFGFGTSNPSAGRVARGHFTKKTRDEITDLDASQGPNPRGQKATPLPLLPVLVMPAPTEDVFVKEMLKVSHRIRGGNPILLEALRPLTADPTKYNPNLSVEVETDPSGKKGPFSLLEGLYDEAISSSLNTHNNLAVEYLRTIEDLINHPKFDPNTPYAAQKLIGLLDPSTMNVPDTKAEEMFNAALKTIGKLANHPNLKPAAKTELVSEVAKTLFESPELADRLLARSNFAEKSAEWFLSLKPNAKATEAMRLQLLGRGADSMNIAERIFHVPENDRAIRLLDEHIRLLKEGEAK